MPDPLLRFLSQPPALAVTCCLIWLVRDGIALLNNGFETPQPAIFALESAAAAQLLLAWHFRRRKLYYEYIYAISFLYFFRLVYHSSIGGLVPWPLRTVNLHNPWLGAAWVGLGLFALHPAARDWLVRAYRAAGERLPALPAKIAALAAAGALFWLLRSRHITRDGFDWIQRAAEPVWHLYMREPLTIGLHRLAYLIMHPLTGWSPRDVIALLSAAAGVTAMVFLHRLIRESFRPPAARLSAWLAALSSSGMTITFFGHIEVYPVFMAGLLGTLWAARRYLDGRGGIAAVSAALSVAFLLHLSAGWLLPAFLALPFVRERENHRPWRDLGTGALIFLSGQAVFWTGLVASKYGASPSAFLSRLHETFFVGPDRAMFIPPEYWFAPWHLWDLVHFGMYAAMAGMALAPLSLVFLNRRPSRENIFWTALLAGYCGYVFTWNPDRGYPEDWDLFTPAVPLLLWFNLNAMLRAEADERGPVSVYLVCMGVLPFVIGQIGYHHTTPFALF